MALNVANWSDKQLDELADLLRTADYSAVAAFIAQNFLCAGSRILTDPTNTTLRVTVNTFDSKAVNLSSGTFTHLMKASQIDADQIINILDTSYGQWGTGKVATGGNRWSIICVKNNEQAHTAEPRWFVDDTVDPNTYSQKDANTLINKAYYDIYVVHGADSGGVPTIPATPSGYFTICEIYVPVGATSILQSNIYDTADPRGSQKSPPNWNTSTRIRRMEYYGGFESGTRVPFHQPSAPLGWQQDVSLNDRALRVVSGSGGGTGGFIPLSAGYVGSHALILAEMPIHFHVYTFTQIYGERRGTGGHYPMVNVHEDRSTSSVGGGQPHTHPLALAYIDVIICQKIS